MIEIKTVIDAEQLRSLLCSVEDTARLSLTNHKGEAVDAVLRIDYKLDGKLPSTAYVQVGEEVENG